MQETTKSIFPKGEKIHMVNSLLGNPISQH